MKQAWVCSSYMLIVLASGCQNSSNGVRQTARVQHVKSASEVKALVDSQGAVVVHTLDAENYRAGHIPGAIHVEYEKMTVDRLPPEKDKPLVFYCAGGMCPVGGMAARKAADWGYTRVYEYSGGMRDWRASGAAVATGE